MFALKFRSLCSLPLCLSDSLANCGEMRATEHSPSHTLLLVRLAFYPVSTMRSCLQCRDAKRKCIPGRGCALSAPCDRCLRHHLPCSRSQANLLRMRALNARRPDSQSSTESQTRDKRVDDFLADDGSVAVLVHEYLSKIHGRPHSIFHDATLWKDIRDRQASRALILAICAMGAHVSNQPSLRSLAPLLTAESKRLLQINLEHVCLDNIQTCILVANLCVAHANPSSEFLFFREFFLIQITRF